MHTPDLSICSSICSVEVKSAERALNTKYEVNSDKLAKFTTNQLLHNLT